MLFKTGNRRLHLVICRHCLHCRCHYCSGMSPFVRLAENSSADVLLSSSSFWASLDSRSLIFESIVFILSSRMKKSWTFLFIVFLNTENIEDGFDASCSSFFNFSISSCCCFNNCLYLTFWSPSFLLLI